MTISDSFNRINRAKANLDDIYEKPDPRAYFRELRKLQYSIPGAAKPVFQKLISRLRRSRDEKLRVLDVGCSYGVNAALLKHDLAMSDLYEHWAQDDLADASVREVVEENRRYFATRDEAQELEVIGLDKSENAVAYGRQVGLLDEGLSVNLEQDALPQPGSERLAEVDMVVSTGCVGYVTEKTFARLLPAVAQERLPWFGTFVLRMFPFNLIEETLDEWGYRTEKLEGQTFAQRQFASSSEREQVMARVSDQGIDTAGKEADGYLHADFYLSRPTGDAEDSVKGLLAA